MRIQRGGGQGGPDPPENHKNIGFSSITGLDLLKITKLQSQHSMWAIIGLQEKRHFNGVIAGRLIFARLWWFLEPHSHRKTKQTKKLIRVGPNLTTLSGFAHDVSYLVLGRIHTKFGIKIFEIDFAIEIYLYLTF